MLWCLRTPKPVRCRSRLPTDFLHFVLICLVVPHQLGRANFLLHRHRLYGSQDQRLWWADIGGADRSLGRVSADALRPPIETRAATGRRCLHLRACARSQRKRESQRENQNANWATKHRHHHRNMGRGFYTASIQTKAIFALHHTRMIASSGGYHVLV